MSYFESGSVGLFTEECRQQRPKVAEESSSAFADRFAQAIVDSLYDNMRIAGMEQERGKHRHEQIEAFLLAFRMFPKKGQESRA